MVNNHNYFINNYSVVEWGRFLAAIRVIQESKSVQNRSQKAYAWPHEQISTNWTRRMQLMHKWDSSSVCVQRRFAVSAFHAISVLLRLHSRNAHVAFLLFHHVAVSLCSRFILQLFVVLALQGSRHWCMTSFHSVNMFVLLAFIVCSSCLRPFMDLSFVFCLSFKGSLFIRCAFNARFALAFALNQFHLSMRHSNFPKLHSSTR